MKIQEIYDYFWDEIDKDLEIQEIEGEDYYNKVVFNAFVRLIDNLLSDKPYDLDLAKTLKSLNRKNDIESIYSLIKREYLYRYVRIKVKSIDFPKDLKRIMLIPIRSTIYEMMMGVLATMDCYGEHLVSLYKKDINFITPIDEGRLYDCSAIDNYTIDILDLKSMNLWYDYGEDWIFNITFNKLEYLEEYVPLKILKFRGRGILEDNKHILYDYLNHIDNEYIEEFDLDDYLLDDLEDINDRAILDYDSLVYSYMGIDRSK
jgi:hypothetical protein